MAKKKFRRRIFLIKKGLQFRYMFSVMIIMLLSTIVVGWTIYYSIWNKVGNNTDFRFENITDIWNQVNILLVRMVPVLIIFVAVFSLMLSHKIAGPAYLFEVSAKQSANGDLGLRIHPRKGDELTDLADVFNRMTSNLEQIVQKDREVIEKIIGVINRIPMSLKQEELEDEEKEQIILELTEVVSELKEVTYAFRLRDIEINRPDDSGEFEADEV